MIKTTSALGLTSAQQKYLDRQLENVSRSFALVIPFLESPLRQYLATAYLLCRVVDNIEDCSQPASWKETRFREFELLLGEPAQASTILIAWDQLQWPGLTELERQLMGVKQGLALWGIYAQIPTAERAVIRKWTNDMAQGMSQLSHPDYRPIFVQRKGIDVLETKTDYDDYCYFVAGTVGHMASELVVRHYGLSDGIAHELESRSDACGRSLQKTNIVKDFAKDLTRSVCYLPDDWMQRADYSPLALRGSPTQLKATVVNDVLDELRVATDYAVAVPSSAAGYRRATILCLLSSYQTMLLAAERQAVLFTGEHSIKISRTTMANCMVDAKAYATNNRAVQAYGPRIEAQIQNHLG